MKKTACIILFALTLTGCTKSPYLYDDGQTLHVMPSTDIDMQESPYKFVYPANGGSYVVPQTAPGFFYDQKDIQGPYEESGLITIQLQ